MYAHASTRIFRPPSCALVLEDSAGTGGWKARSPEHDVALGMGMENGMRKLNGWTRLGCEMGH